MRELSSRREFLSRGATAVGAAALGAALVPGSAEAAPPVAGRLVSVRDFGAKGDGTLISKSFMIFGDIFLLKEAGEHGGGLSTYLSQCWLEGMHSYGIQVNDGTRPSVMGAELTCGYARAVVKLNNGTYARMASCYFRNSRDSVGVRVNAGSGLMMSDCEFAGAPGFTGIEINPAAQSIISGNFLHHCEVGISATKTADNYIITNNQIAGNNTPLAMAGGNKTLVKDNL